MLSHDAKLQEYPLARGLVDSIRLTLGHFIWKKYFPYTFHPSFQPHGAESGLKIADVGCGTGIWLLEAIEEYPTAQFDGFDISLHQAPPQSLLPQNMCFKYLDIDKPIPDELVGQYDFVTVRFMIALVRDDDPGHIIKALLQMLKPGGYIQWGEADIASTSYVGLEENDISKESSALQKLRSTVLSLDGRFTPSWPMRLPSFFEKHGLTDIVFDKRNTATKKGLLHYSSHAFIAAISEILAKFPPGGFKDQLGDLLEAASGETMKGVAWGADSMVVLGRKPF